MPVDRRPGNHFIVLETLRRHLGVFMLPWGVAALLPLAILPPHAIALPAGGHVAAGAVTATFDGAHLRLDQTTRAAIMNWDAFDIGRNEIVRIVQPGADAAMLARVTGGAPTELHGRLDADGRLFLINPRGVLVGPEGTIDTAAFLASTHDVADSDFLRGGPLTFRSDSTAGVTNLGRITAREGDVLLLAHTVKNAGEISAPRGTAGLAAGTEIVLAAPDSPAIVVRASLPAARAPVGVENSGVIAAAQAHVEASGGSVYDVAINQRGLVRATGYETRAGRVVFTAAGGSIDIDGTIGARNADGSGGTILVGGDLQGENPSVPNATRTRVAPAARLDASASSETGDGGRVIVWADEATRFAGTIEARAGAVGGDGGFAEVSGKRSLAFTGTADLSAPGGRRGELLLDPDNLTIVGGTTNPVPPNLDADKNWSFAEDPGAQTLGADTLAGLLLNSSVTLQASDTLTVDAPITVATGGAAAVTLTLQASTLAINQSISLAGVTDGQLNLTHHIAGPGTSLTTAAGATLAAPGVRIDGFPITTLNGPVNTSRLSYVNLQAPTLLTATHASNSIGEFVLVSDEADPQTIAFGGTLSVHSSSAMNVAARLQSAGGLTLTAGGDLTVRDFAGAVPFQTTLNVGGTARVGSTGGVFVNQAGADLFAGAGRRLIYTANVGGSFSLGGLAGFTTVNGVSFPQDPQPGLANVVYRADGLLTITANSFSRLYGQPDPAFTASYSGGTAANLTTLPTLSLLGGPAVNVGTYTIVPAGAASDTHTINYVNGTLTINPATLTYVADAAGRTTLASNPVFSGSVTGFVNGDTLASATAGTLSFTSPATDSSPAGTYAINGSGLTANHGNYVFVQAAGNATAFSITPPAGNLTITADSFSRLYGQPNPVFTASYSGGTAANLTTLPTLSLLGGPAVNVGTYTIVPAGAASDTHTISYVNGTLRIDPATLTYVASPASRTTVGPDPLFGGSVTGFVNGDTLASATAGTLSFATTATSGSPAGAYAINGSGLTANHGNYVFVQAPANATAFTINAAPLLTITASDFIRLYGQPDPVFTVSFAGGTAADLTKAPVVTIAGGPAINTGRYTLVPSGAASATHELAYVNGTLTINPATLTYVAHPATRLYGEPNPAFNGTVTGFVNGDTLASATAGTLTFTSPATETTGAGTHAIHGGGLTALHGNYVFQDASANFDALTIGKAPLTIAFANATRVYGAPDPLFTATFTGFRNGDTVSALAGFAAGTNATPQSPVGTYQIGGSAQAANYALTIVPGTLSITPAPLSVQIGSASWMYGEPGPVPAMTVSGLVAGDAPSAVVRLANPTSLQSPVGTYAARPELLSANYTLGAVSGGVLTINPRPLVVAAADAVKRQFEGLPAFDVALSGVTPFDLAAATAHFSRPVTTARADSPPGTYEVRPVGDPASPFANLANYSVTLRPGTLTVEPARTEIVTSTFITYLDPRKEEDAKKEIEQMERNNRLQVSSSIHGLGHPAYRPLMVDAVERLRQAAASDPELRRTLEESGLLDVLTKSGNDAFLADVARDATRQSLLVRFINEVMLDYAQRPRDSLSPEMGRLVDHLRERAQEQKRKEALLIVTEFDKWAKQKAERMESLGATGQFQAVYGWTAVPPDFKQQIKAEQMAAALGSGLVAGAITGAGLGAAFMAKTAAFVAAGTTGKVLAGVAGSAAGFGAGAGAVVLAAVIIGVVRGIQVFDEERVMADVQAARDLLRNPQSAGIDLQDTFDRMSFSTGVMNFINENGFAGI